MKYLLVFLLLGGFCHGFAQSIVNLAGGTMSNATMSIEQNVGELAITTILGNGQSATQGLLQPTYTVMTEANETFDDTYGFKAYPNPVSEQLNIETDYDGFVSYRIFNINGQIVQEGGYDYHPLEMGPLRSGTYIIQLIAREKNYSKIIKIIKQ
ncbi:MAG: T9SS type A sorting domain-containing protein [Saprospiraceae bacterium]|nr:T9SS type A sorting domain-containing protein [Saprospiraceae bacterium]MCF8251225.1 T9SS type A sorting domain-containing protein [Saprospiraceae bacterium]MCF8281209.1 T9SS type A sorting domain-containing protein [Bacteroidales bacterium]MCF8313151.1 T9SS type A sorting domain-containing protein [Saprospiraceae bacterium]MCF8441587.1 T9SS type A sorting domain-containing protein [Saprospiraceae bacterium]